MVNNTAKIVWKQFALSVLIFAISQLIVILWQVIDSVTIIKSLQAIRVPFDVAITEKESMTVVHHLFRWIDCNYNI